MLNKKLVLTLSVVALIAACGKSEAPAPPASAPAPVAAPVVEAAPAVDEHLVLGEKMYKSTCGLCHGSGAAGAPLFKSKTDWEPRVAQGMPTLYEHAINGYTGKNGMMPARGGNAKLTDDEVKAGVDYMVAQAK